MTREGAKFERQEGREVFVRNSSALTESQAAVALSTTPSTPEERAQVYERLAALSPPPQGVTRAAVLAGNRDALDRWWDSIGVTTGSWWTLKGKW